MKDDKTFIAEESIARLRATICELNQLIQGENCQAERTELQQLKDKITSVLQQLESAHC